MASQDVPSWNRERGWLLELEALRTDLRPGA